MNSKNHPAYWEAEWISRHRNCGYYRDCFHESRVIQQIVGRRSLASSPMLTGLTTLKLGNYDGDLVKMVSGRAYHEQGQTKSSHGNRLAEVVITCPIMESKLGYANILNNYESYKNQVIHDITEETNHVLDANPGMFKHPAHNELLKTVFSEFDVDDHWKKVHYSQEDKMATMLIVSGVYKEPFSIELYFHL